MCWHGRLRCCIRWRENNACGTDTAGGQSPVNEIMAMEDKMAGEERTAVYQAVAKAQLEAWKNGIGYFYWNYKLLLDTVNEPGWIGWDC